jgi:hypothetical protein
MSRAAFFTKVILFLFSVSNLYGIPHYYVTCADQKFYPRLQNLLNSIYKNDRSNIAEIAIFDLGFTLRQRLHLKKMHKVKVFDIEMKHSDLLKFFCTDVNRFVRGWFAWKPVAIKQALEKYPYILYLDSALEVLKPLNFLFEHIKEKHYFLVDSEAYIYNRITQYTIEKVVKNIPNYEENILGEKSCMHCGGIQGLSREMLKDYINPIYNHVTDIDLFADDGSALLGFGSARHDQTLFSIYGRKLGLRVFRSGWNKLEIKGKIHKFHIHWDRKLINENTCIYY